MTLASVGQKMIAFVYFTLIARELGAGDTGKYVLALSFTTIFVVFVDLGFTNVLIRESAKARDKMQTFFSTTLATKVILGALSYIALIVTVHVLDYSPEIRQLVYLSGVTMLFDSFHLTIYGTLRAIGDLRYEAASIIASQLITLILGSVFLFGGFPLIYLILAFTIPSALNACFAAYIAKAKYHTRFSFVWNKQAFQYLSRIAIPFALAAIFARVYSYIDSILLSKLADEIAVGWYAIAYKITFAFQFIPLALVAAVYPRFSEYFSSDKKKLAYIFEQSLKYLWIVAFPIAVGIGLLSHDIILSVYTDEYLNSVLPLQILIASLLFSYVSFPIGAFLNACDKQVTQTVIVGLVMLVNIGLNVWLIPTHGVVGAAIAAFAGNALLAVAGYTIVPKITRISHRFIAKTFFQVGIAAGVMGIGVWFINQSQHFVIAIMFGAVLYPIMLFATRAITSSQLKEAKLLVSK